jgi:Asp-tRNA(Asn)/Glu-tRNA(Gln) amidotransferase C subunit
MELKNLYFERRNKMDENSIKELLNEEIAEEIRTLSMLESGSKEKSTAIDDLTQLYKLRIEENKSELDADEKYNRRVMEDESNIRDDEVKRIQIAEQVKDRYFKLGIAAAELMIPLIFYGVWMKKGFKFEETGTYTSTTFRGLFNRFRPTKK